MSNIIPIETIQSRIIEIRGERVMLDTDLAELYRVKTSRLNEQVKRNIKRFPSDFMFQLTREEFENLKSHFATSSWGGRRTYPYAFTEQGVAMLSSVLKSERAVEVNIAIMRAFVKLRKMIASHADLLRKVEAMERKYDGQFKIVFEVMKKLMEPLPPEPKQKIGFLP